MAILFHIQSAIVLAILYGAYFSRRNRRRHVRLAVFGIIWDLILILQIELSRGAVEKAVQIERNPWILNYHVAVAVTVVVLYGILGVLGRKLLRGNEAVRPWHRRFGILALILRTSTLITAYFVA